MDHAVLHVGRFSGDYKDLFGELASQRLANSRLQTERSENRSVLATASRVS
jgi:hypothetical protein